MELGYTQGTGNVKQEHMHSSCTSSSNIWHIIESILTPFKVPRSCNLYSLFSVFTVITACCLSTLLDWKRFQH